MLALERLAAVALLTLGLRGMALQLQRRLYAKYQDAAAARSLAYFALKNGKHEEAESWYQKALVHAPADANTWFNLGFVQDRLGRKREAAESFRQSLRLNAGFDRAWHGLAEMLQHLGEWDEACSAWRKTCVLQPSNPGVLLQLARALIAASRGDELQDVLRRLESLEETAAETLRHEMTAAGLAQKS